MQQTPQTSFPPSSITTEQIQKYLDENKKLILAILDNQNLGKLAECAQYQAQLQKNLMYLAAIADAQPQIPPNPHESPHAPHVIPQGPFYMHHPQAFSPASPAPQRSVFPAKMPSLFNSPQQIQAQSQHLQLQAHSQNLQIQAMQNPTGMRPSTPTSTTANTALLPAHLDGSATGNAISTPSGSVEAHEASKLDTPEGGDALQPQSQHSPLGDSGSVDASGDAK